MRVIHVLATAVSLAAAVSGTVLAADTPGSNPSVPRVSVSDRLETARKALAAHNYDGALRELQTAVREDPRNAEIHNLLGYGYRKRSSPDLAKAFEHYRTALRLDPRHKGAHEYIGEAYLMDKKPAQAEEHLRELEKICGGTACEEYQDLAKAIEAYKRTAAK